MESERTRAVAGGEPESGSDGAASTAPSLPEAGNADTVDIGLRERETRANLLVRQLRVADASKDAFISMLSHELRNPLAAIGMALDLLQDASSADVQAAWAWGVASRQTRHLATLVDDLLDVTRMARNQIVIKRQLVDLNALIVATANDNRSFFDERDVSLDVQTCPGRVGAHADPERLTQALSNLLHNASKHSRLGSTVIFSLSHNATQQQAMITVADTGSGISPSALEALFDPYAPGEVGYDRLHDGLGLGLAVVKWITELHDGSISVASDGLGCGSRFTVTLPTVDTATAMPDAVRPTPHIASRPLRILLIEDNEPLRQLTALQLERFGHAVLPAATATAGLHMLAGTPDVVVCDICLPDMDGYQLARRIRNNATSASIPMIALTGYGQSDDVKKALASGFDRHLTKPVDMHTLAAVLDEVTATRDVGA